MSSKGRPRSSRARRSEAAQAHQVLDETPVSDLRPHGGAWHKGAQSFISPNGKLPPPTNQSKIVGRAPYMGMQP